MPLRNANQMLLRPLPPPFVIISTSQGGLIRFKLSKSACVGHLKLMSLSSYLCANYGRSLIGWFSSLKGFCPGTLKRALAKSSQNLQHILTSSFAQTFLSRFICATLSVQNFLSTFKRLLSLSIYASNSYIYSFTLPRRNPLKF